MNGQITYVNTIERFAIALIRNEGQTLCAEFVRITGADYDLMERSYGLANFCGLEPYWSKN